MNHFKANETKLTDIVRASFAPLPRGSQGVLQAISPHIVHA